MTDLRSGMRRKNDDGSRGSGGRGGAKGRGNDRENGTSLTLKLYPITQKETLYLRDEIWWQKPGHELHLDQNQWEIARMERTKGGRFGLIRTGSLLMCLTVAGGRVIFSVDRLCNLRLHLLNYFLKCT